VTAVRRATRERPLAERLAGSPLLPAIEGWLEVLRKGRRLSENTLDAYRRDALDYAVFAAAHGVGEWSSLTRTVLDAYLASLFRARRARNTLMRRRSALGRFHTFLVREGILPADFLLELPPARSERRLPAALAPDEIESLLARDGEASPLELRTRAMLELAYASGLRVSELLTLQCAGIHLGEQVVTVVGKGNKQRQVPFGREAARWLRAYLERGRPLLAPRAHHDTLFVNARGGPMSRMGFWKLLRARARAAGISTRVHPHALRHSFATHLLQGGADLRVVQELMGHANVTTTSIYTHLDRAYLREVHREFHPRGKRAAAGSGAAGARRNE